MKAEAQMRAQLLVMSTMDGVRGCALVEAATGLVWHATGSLDDVTRVAEAATDYWRIHQRHESVYRELGKLQAQVLMYAAQRITIVGCGHGLVLILISESADRVNWALWKKRVGELKALVDGA